MTAGDMDAGWRERMLDFYLRLDAELAAAGGVCRGCGGCCHFDRVDHVLYASELERRLLVASGVPPSNPDAPPDLIAAGLRCPYQKDNHCLAREGRVLGCRLHFCSWAGTDNGEELAERWHRRLKELHDELGVEWNYRPLLPLRFH